MNASSERLPVVILAGGLATRLRPLTERIPKSLIEVDGHPFLWHQLRLLRRAGVRHVVLLVGYLGENIQNAFGDGVQLGMTLDYSFDGPVLLGTGGAIRQALSLLPERFFVLYGDSYLTCDYAAVESAFHRTGLSALMTVYRNEERFDASNVEFDGARILRYDKVHRTPAMKHIDYGLGLFHRSVFENLPAGEKQDLAGVYKHLLASGNLAAFEVLERFYEIGTPEGLRDTESLLRESAAGPQRAVFLDRDGVLNEAIVRDGKPYAPVSPEQFRLLPGTAEALGRLKDRGFTLLVVTNQPEIARGNQSLDSVAQMHRRLLAELPVDGVYVCVHDETQGCDCRKPLPGMFRRGAFDHEVELGRSYAVGDRWRDVDAGAAAGCKTVWLDRGYRERAPSSVPDARVKTLAEAVDWILKDAGISPPGQEGWLRQ